MAKKNKTKIDTNFKNNWSKFFSIIIISLLIIIIINSIYVSKILINKIDYKKEELLFKNKNFNILILGDSHPAYGLNPEYLSNSINLAVPSESYILNYFKLKKILNGTNNISVVILPIDIHSFTSYRKNQVSDIYYWKNYISNDELINLTDYNIIRIEINKYLPIIGNGEDIITYLFFQGNINIKNNGWLYENKSLTNLNYKDKIKTAKSRIKLQIPNKDNLFNKTQLLYFKKIIDITNNNNITLIFIKFPVSKYYLDSLNESNISINKFYSDLNLTINNYNNVKIVNFQNIFIMNDSYFFNNDHLNYKGANYISKMINNITNEIINK